MKRCPILLTATVLSGVSLTAYAAQPVSNLDSGQLRSAGAVSATGTSNLSNLEGKLAEKTREQSMKGYVINSASGNDQVFGAATICKQPHQRNRIRLWVQSSPVL